jgi:hypothetical protein
MNIKNPYNLIQNIVDAQENFIIIIEHEKPILMNQSFCKFFGVKNLEEYSSSFGDFVNNFVPHPSYFHKDKCVANESWLEALLKLDEKDRVVSMLNSVHEPRAFSVSINNNHENYAVVTLKDISADLIKCIMIENDVSMDKRSGAYNKDYFIHTSEILLDGARFNEKHIGITLMQLLDECDMQSVVNSIKGVSRQNDMLVKYSRNTLLMAYLVDKKDNALIFSKKLQTILNPQVNNKMLVSLLKDNVKVEPSISALVNKLEALEKGELKLF